MKLNSEDTAVGKGEGYATTVANTPRTGEPPGQRERDYTGTGGATNFGITEAAYDASRVVISAVPKQYKVLYDTLMRAYEQSAHGKGRERHATNEPFQDQHIVTISRACGVGFATGQAVKKIYEASRMIQEGKNAAAVHELLGAIVYTAAAIVVTENEQKVDT